MASEKKECACVLKTVYEKPGSAADIRRLNFGTERTFEKLVEFIRRSYVDLTNRNFVVKYADDEGDLVTITNTMELVEAFNCSSGNSKVLKLLVTAADAKTECAKSSTSVGSATASSTTTPPPASSASAADPLRGMREDTGVAEVLSCARRLLCDSAVRNELPVLVHSFLAALGKGDHVKTAVDTAVASCSVALRSNPAFARLLELEALWLPQLERAASSGSIAPERITWICSMLPMFLSAAASQLCAASSTWPADLSALLSSLCGAAGLGAAYGAAVPAVEAKGCDAHVEAKCCQPAESATESKATAGPVHRNITCDGCGVSPITGVRFKCTVCPDFDLCAGCESAGRHDKHHPLIKMSVPQPTHAFSAPPPPAGIPGVHFPPMPPPPMHAGMSGASVASACCGGPHMWSVHAGAPAVRQMCRQWTRAMRGCRRGGGGGGGGRWGGGAGSGGWREWWRAADEAGSDTGENTAAAGSAGRLYSSRVLAHVTLLDRCAVRCAQTLVKTWKMLNSGRVPWPPGSKLIFVRGDRELLGAQEQFPVVAAGAGEAVEVSAVLQTPLVSSATRMVAYFRLADCNGVPFGCRLWADVLVTPDAPPAAAAQLGSSSLGSAAAAAASEVSGASAENVAAGCGCAVAASSSSGAAVSSGPGSANQAATEDGCGENANQLRALDSMGFKNRDLNAALLAEHNGNLQETVSALVELMQP